MIGQATVVRLPDAEAVAAATAERLEREVHDALTARGAAHVALSGGSTPRRAPRWPGRLTPVRRPNHDGMAACGRPARRGLHAPNPRSNPMKLGLINSAWAQAGRETAFGVRMTKETKNGNRTRKSSVDLCLPPWKAIQYATG